MMRTIVAFLCIAILAISEPIELKQKNGVYQLTEANFGAALKKHPNMLVKFYAPWCGHCKKLAPEYEKAAKTIQKKELPIEVVLGEVDATENSGLAQEFEVRGYPTLKFFKGNRKDAREYGGGRSEKEIVEWLSRHVLPATKKLESMNDLEALQKEHDVVVVGLFKTTDPMLEVYKAVAQDVEDVEYVETDNEQIANSLDAPLSSLVLLKNFDEKKNVLKENLNQQSMEAFIKTNKYANVIDFTEDKSKQIFAGDVQNHMLYFNPTEKYDEKRFAAFNEIAKTEKGKFMFVTVTPKKDTSHLYTYFGIQNDEERIVAISMESNKKYKLEQEITLENLKTFSQHYFAKQLKAYLKSAEEPTDNDTKLVKTLVGKNFDKIALDTKKNVFIKFYAPWCGHCKALSPVWEKLGEEYKNSNDVIIAEFDATTNEVDHKDINVRGFPTLYFIQANDNKVLKYEGERQFDDLKNYIEEHRNVVPAEDDL